MFPYNQDGALSADGKYVVRLYDVTLERYVEVQVDDAVPCNFSENWGKLVPMHGTLVT